MAILLLSCILVCGLAGAVVDDGGAGIEGLPLELRLELERVLQQEMAAADQVLAARTADGRFVPGRARPLLAPQPQALTIVWEGYESVIAIEPGPGGRPWRRAWIATFEQSGALMVAYAGVAFLAADGDLHIDCRRVHLSGPYFNRWSPDSFAIQSDGLVRIADDQGQSSSTRQVEWHRLGEPSYRHSLLLARAMAEGLL